MININPSWNIVNLYPILLLEKVYDKKKIHIVSMNSKEQAEGISDIKK